MRTSHWKKEIRLLRSPATVEWMERLPWGRQGNLRFHRTQRVPHRLRSYVSVFVIFQISMASFSYPWSEDPENPESFMKTRAPAWCDRVLMNEEAFSIAKNGSPHYDSIGKTTCIGDHKVSERSLRCSLKSDHHSGSLCTYVSASALCVCPFLWKLSKIQTNKTNKHFQPVMLSFDFWTSPSALYARAFRALNTPQFSHNSFARFRR